jgi:autotransporter-associated beta strand protein
MKLQKSRFVITLASALLLAPAAFALDGKWNVAGNGSWNTPGNWLSGTTADGAEFTADFTGFSGNITLDGNRTIGNLIFSDATWYVTRTLSAGSGGSLTLVGTTPTITVNAMGFQNKITITTAILGTQGLTKDGVGPLELSGGAANTLTGAINVDAGTLTCKSGGDGFSSLKNMPQTITVASGGTLSYDQGFGGDKLVNNLQLSGPGISGSGALNLAGNATATGTITLNADATISHDYNSGTIAGPITGTDRNLELKTSVNGQAGLTVSGPISLGTGGITVKGAANGGGFSVKLSGTNSYSGTTTVTAGTLALSGNGSIANTATINIAANATFDVSAVTGPSYANPSGRTLAFTIDKTGTTFKQGQLNIGAKNLTYGGPLTVTKSGTGALASGDTFTLVTTTGGTFGGWFSSVLLPALTTGLAWNTNGLATTGVLDIYNFTTTPLALSTPMNAAATLFAAKLANHASSSKQASPYPTGWNATATTPINGGSVVVNGNGSLTYTPDGLANVNGGTDSFTVTFNDGYGSQTMAVSVAVGTSPSGGQSPNVLTSGTDGSGNFYALFAGLPNTTYTVQTNSIASGSTWVKYGNYTTVGDGLINVTNVPPVAGSLFFRTVWPNY